MERNNSHVMDTNNNSIVSKRSVERLYYPDEPHFYRFFVRKFQRRSPLTNRWYFLRLRAIDIIVKNFLQSSSDGRHKVVVNLGCGSDVLPWRCLSRHPGDCEDTSFVDVDFPDLMLRKASIIKNTPELASMLPGLEYSGHLPCPLRSDKYVLIGSDLRDLSTIEKTLSSSIRQAREAKDCKVLFIAEVSITYMETTAADAVIEWASSMAAMGQAEFCLLEHMLPDGQDHPFAKTMVEYYNKLKTPIKSVSSYPNIPSQRERFARRGWNAVQAWSLWDAWQTPSFFSPEDRVALDVVEPFDEWEELALSAGHYVLIHATTSTQQLPTSTPTPPQVEIPAALASLSMHPLPSPKSYRRFGAGVVMRDLLGRGVFLNYLGLGSRNRSLSYDIHSKGEPLGGLESKGIFPTTSPQARMCHTVTDTGDFGLLLVGGRSSPSAPLSDCWVLKKSTGSWEPGPDLPDPLFRHSIVRLGDSSLCFLCGGKTSASTLFQQCLVFIPFQGWVRCVVKGKALQPTFGSVLYCTGPSSQSPTVFAGLLLGGMAQDGTISRQTLHWELDVGLHRDPSVTFKELSLNKDLLSSGLAHRFGATAVNYKGTILLLGGVTRNTILPQSHDILQLLVSPTELGIVSRVDYPSSIERPLLIGSSISLAGSEVIIAGGGATAAFSSGTFWAKHCYSLTINADTEHPEVPGHPGTWIYCDTVDLSPYSRGRGSESLPTSAPPSTPQPIPRVRLQDKAAFGDILKNGKPVVLEGLDMGSCMSKWSVEYLAAAVGDDRQVIVHESSGQTMDFNSKNFKYVNKSFSAFMAEVKGGATMYMRALSTDKPTDEPANFSRDFPSISDDFDIPRELDFVQERLFSSVFRIGGKANMWLHYDASIRSQMAKTAYCFPHVSNHNTYQVMANVYCQIVGVKRMILFPPSEVGHLSFAPGASSSSIDVFSMLEQGGIPNTCPQEALVGPGDILFIPPLWLHTAKPVSDMSVAVNAFFRDLNSGYSAGRDVYGNRDLHAYEKARQDISRIANMFKGLRSESRAFYISRLADELSQKSPA